VTVSVLVPPENVGVAPITWPLVPWRIVTLWASGELLMNCIKIVPAFAVSELLVNLSLPLGSAAIVKAVPACPGELAGAVDSPGEVEVAGAPTVLDALLLDPPQAVRPIAAMASARAAVILGMLVGSFRVRLLSRTSASAWPTPGSAPLTSGSGSRTNAKGL
jgi:hypothetical protein